MASTTFVDRETLIEASWLNDVNAVVYTPGTQTAADIANVPAGSIAATDVQAALNELDGDIQTKQPLDATLTALAAVVNAADQINSATGPDAFSPTPLTAFARTMLDDTTGDAVFTTLGAVMSLGASGYQKLPGGLIIQWGRNAAGTVTLPIAFPTAGIGVVATATDAPSSRIFAATAGLSLTQFTLATYDTNPTAVRTGHDCDWFALGY